MSCLLKNLSADVKKVVVLCPWVCNMSWSHSGLTQLVFGNSLRGVLVKGMLPSGLLELEFRAIYSYVLLEGVLPSSLLKLRLEGHFSQKSDILPESLRVLHLNRSVKWRGYLPSSLRELVFGPKFQFAPDCVNCKPLSWKPHVFYLQNSHNVFIHGPMDWLSAKTIDRPKQFRTFAELQQFLMPFLCRDVAAVKVTYFNTYDDHVEV